MKYEREKYDHLISDSNVMELKQQELKKKKCGHSIIYTLTINLSLLKLYNILFKMEWNGMSFAFKL